VHYILLWSIQTTAETYKVLWLAFRKGKWAELRHLNGLPNSEMDWHHFIMLSVQYVHLHIKWMTVMHIKELAYKNMHVSLKMAVSFGSCWSLLRQDMNMQLTDCSEGRISYSNCWAELCCWTLGLAGNRLAHIPCEHKHRCQNGSWYWREGDFVALSWCRNSQKLHLQSSERRTLQMLLRVVQLLDCFHQVTEEGRDVVTANKNVWFMYCMVPLPGSSHEKLRIRNVLCVRNVRGLIPYSLSIRISRFKMLRLKHFEILCNYSVTEYHFWNLLKILQCSPSVINKSKRIPVYKDHIWGTEMIMLWSWQ
jgi:hypothetical protein